MTNQNSVRIGFIFKDPNSVDQITNITFSNLSKILTEIDLLVSKSHQKLREFTIF